jgi:hypothetical protein
MPSCSPMLSLGLPGLTSCPTAKYKDLKNQPYKNCEQFTSIFINFNPFSHPRLHEHLYYSFFILLDQSE